MDSFSTSQRRQAVGPQKTEVVRQAELPEPSSHSYARSRITQQPILHLSNALFLQRVIGNRAVCQLLAQQRSAPAHAQPAHSPLGQAPQDSSEPGGKISPVQPQRIQRADLGEDDETYPRNDEIAKKIRVGYSMKFIVTGDQKLYKHDLGTSEVLGRLKDGTKPIAVAALPRSMGRWMLIKAEVVGGDEKWGFVPPTSIAVDRNAEISDDEFSAEISDDEDDEGASIEGDDKGEDVDNDEEIERTTYEDDEIFYGKKTQRLILHGYTLIKDQELYTAPTQLSTVLGTIVKDIVPYRVMESSEPGWLQVRTKLAKGQKEDKSGYIPKTAVRHAPLHHKSLDDKPIMPTTGPEPSQIVQHRFADCYFLAALSNLARRNPAFIKNELFRTDPTVTSATYTVRFYRDNDLFSSETESFQPEDVTVNRSILRFVKDVPSINGNTQHNVKMQYKKDMPYGAKGEWIWPAIVEKAYAAWTNMKIDYGHGLEAVKALTGKQYKNFSIVDESENSSDQGTVAEPMEPLDKHRDRLIQALKEPGKIVMVSSLPKAPPGWLKLVEKNNKGENTNQHNEMIVGGIVFSHGYDVVAADKSMIKLRNPWGRYSRIGGEIDKESEVSELTWDEFFATFSGYRIEKSDKPSKD